MKKELYKLLATNVDAYHRCASDTANPSQRSWKGKWVQRTEKLVRDHLPSGAGVDGLHLDIQESSGELLTFQFTYHHMNDHGFYTHRTRHCMSVTPSMIFNFDLEIESPDDGDFDDLYDHLYETFGHALSEEVPDI